MVKMKPYEYLEHTADVKFRAYGKSPDEMLSNAALALFNSMIDTATVQAKETWKVELSGPDLEQLAYDWLSELVFLFETEFAVFSTFDVKLHQNSDWSLQAVIGGERIDKSRHAFDNEVKAVTHHKFEIKKNNLWCIQVVLDV
jgi:SHS2 domain-containing protein